MTKPNQIEFRYKNISMTSWSMKSVNGFFFVILSMSRIQNWPHSSVTLHAFYSWFEYIIVAFSFQYICWRENVQIEFLKFGLLISYTNIRAKIKLSPKHSIIQYRIISLWFVMLALSGIHFPRKQTSRSGRRPGY